MYLVNQLPVRDLAKSKTGCCPPFDPNDWDEQLFTFENKPFLKFSTRSFMHIPINMSAMMRKTMAVVEEAGADSHEHLMLSEEISPWKAVHYLAVSKEIPQATVVRLTGKYLAKVFEGPYKNMRLWHSQLLEYVKSKDFVPIKTYFNYVLCPKCAKAYGHNYVVGFEQIA